MATRTVVSFGDKKIVIPIKDPTITVSQCKQLIATRLELKDFSNTKFKLFISDAELCENDTIQELGISTDDVLTLRQVEPTFASSTSSSPPCDIPQVPMLQFWLKIFSKGWMTKKLPASTTIGHLRNFVLQSENKENDGYICQLFTDEMPIFHSEESDAVSLAEYGIKDGDNVYAILLSESLQRDMYKYKFDSSDLFKVDPFWRQVPTAEGVVITDKSLACLLCILGVLKSCLTSNTSTLPKTHLMSVVREKFDFPPGALCFYHLVLEAMQFEKTVLCACMVNYLHQLLPHDYENCLLDYSNVFFYQAIFEKDPSNFQEEFYEEINLVDIYTSAIIENPVFCKSLEGGDRNLYDESTVKGLNAVRNELQSDDRQYEYVYAVKFKYLMQLLKSQNLQHNYPSTYYHWKGKHTAASFEAQNIVRWSQEKLDQVIESIRVKQSFVPFCYTDGEKLRGKKTLALDSNGFTVMVLNKTKDEEKPQFNVIDPIYSRATLAKKDFLTGESFKAMKKPVSKVERQNMKISQIDVVLLDTSGSMQNKPENSTMTKFEFSKAYLSSFIDKLEAYDLSHAVGIFSFDEKCEQTFPISTNFDHAINTLGKLKANGSSTKLFDSISYAIDQIKEFEQKDPSILADNYEKRIICFTDGQDTSGNSGFSILEKAQKEHVIIDCVPCGKVSDFADIKSLCYASCGVCCLILSNKESISLFQSEAMLQLKSRAPHNYGRNVNNELVTTQKEYDLLKDMDKYPMMKQVKFAKPVMNKKAVKSTQLGAESSSSTTSKTQSMTRSKRIFMEFTKVKSQCQDHFTPYMDEQNFSFWKIVFKGPVGSNNANKYFLLYVEFPQDYPNVPPSVRFETKIYHCNINDDGKICHQLLNDTYSQMVSMSSILKEICDMMISPNFDDALDSLKASLYKSDPNEYHRLCLEWCNQYGFKTLKEIEDTYNLV